MTALLGSNPKQILSSPSVHNKCWPIMHFWQAWHPVLRVSNWPRLADLFIGIANLQIYYLSFSRNSTSI